MEEESLYFEKGLKYIQDKETFLNIISKNKEAIFEKYNSQKIDNIIKLNDLQFKKIEKPHIIVPEGNENNIILQKLMNKKMILILMIKKSEYNESD